MSNTNNEVSTALYRAFEAEDKDMRNAAIADAEIARLREKQIAYVLKVLDRAVRTVDRAVRKRLGLSGR